MLFHVVNVIKLQGSECSSSYREKVFDQYFLLFFFLELMAALLAIEISTLI